MNAIEDKVLRVERIVYYNNESRWGILATSFTDPKDEIRELLNKYDNVTVSGNFEGVYEGCEIRVSGIIVENPKFGKQLQLTSFKIIHDTKSKESIINFLARSVIKGISIQNAKKIYQAYKDKAIEVTLNNPDVLIGISGIGQKTVSKIKKSIKYYKDNEELITFCTDLGVPYSVIMKLQREFGKEALTLIKEDPYKILDLSTVMSFRQVDEIYLKGGGSKLDEKRLEKGLLYCLKNTVTLEGSTGCSSRTLEAKFRKLLELDSNFTGYDELLQTLTDEDKVYTQANKLGTTVYYKEYLNIEKEIAENIKNLSVYGSLNQDKLLPEVVEEELHNFPFELNQQQIQAVHTCLKSNVSILTGAAGCIDGDTIIRYNRASFGSKRSIRGIYEALHGISSRQWRKDIPTKVRSYIKASNVISLNDAEDIIYSGRQGVYKLTLEDGKTLKATADHKILTENGYKPLLNLTAQDKVMVDTLEYPRYTENGIIPNYRYSKVVSVKYIGQRDTYDIACYKDHNFNANGIIVHNSGKSSITKALYKIFTRCGFNVVLLSPTAKACRRLEECTGGKASTIHKYIGMNASGDYNEEIIPEKTVVIVDEASMMDIIIFRNLLNKANSDTRFILVGDNNQLPSVMAGNVLGDLIDSREIPVAVLTDVMRQKEDSNIINFCNMTNKGEIFDPCEKKDFHYEEFGTADELKDTFIDSYLEDVSKYGLSEVQVIAPYKLGELGMNTLNKLLQSAYNPDGTVLVEPFRVGDRVRHTQNNYDKNVFNGETGIVEAFTNEQLEAIKECAEPDEDDYDLCVNYGDKVVCYDRTNIEELTLAYCSTVHASQGSEYKVVYVTLDDTSVNDFLLIRRLLYTAISRGKEKVYILTKPYLVDKCIANDVYRPRTTKLKDFIKEVQV